MIQGQGVSKQYALECEVDQLKEKLKTMNGNMITGEILLEIEHEEVEILQQKLDEIQVLCDGHKMTAGILADKIEAVIKDNNAVQ